MDKKVSILFSSPLTQSNLTRRHCRLKPFADSHGEFSGGKEVRLEATLKFQEMGGDEFSVFFAAEEAREMQDWLARTRISKSKRRNVSWLQKKSSVVLLVVLSIMSLTFASANQVQAETTNYKFYSWVIKAEGVPVGDVKGHGVLFNKLGIIFVHENGEVATGNAVAIGDWVNLTGSLVQYSTVKYSDGSTLIVKFTDINFTGSPGSLESAEWKGEIIHGTGRYEGVKGETKGKTKYLPLEEGEAGQRSYGEGTSTYTLPSK